MASRSYTRTKSDIDTEIDEEIEQEQNPIKKNATKFANQKQILQTKNKSSPALTSSKGLKQNMN